MNNVTRPNFISKIYFNFIYKCISKIIIENQKKNILDFGCGTGNLKKKLSHTNINIFNYDKDEKLTDIKNWKEIDFDTIVFCQVLMYIDKKNIIEIFKEINNRKKIIDIIVLFSTQSFLNKIFALLLGHFSAHKNTTTLPMEEEEICLENFILVKRKNYFFFKLLYLKNN